MAVLPGLVELLANDETMVHRSETQNCRTEGGLGLVVGAQRDTAEEDVNIALCAAKHPQRCPDV